MQNLNISKEAENCNTQVQVNESKNVEVNGNKELLVNDQNTSPSPLISYFSQAPSELDLVTSAPPQTPQPTAAAATTTE